MITTVTLNPAIDREYFVEKHQPKSHEFIYDEEAIKVYPGGKGVLSAINLKGADFPDVQNIGFVGGRQGYSFEKMVREYGVITNYIHTENEIRNNVFIIGKSPVTYTFFNDYTYQVNHEDVNELLKRFRRAISDSQYILITGSIPAGVDFDIYRKLLDICNRTGKKVFLQASGEALNRSLISKPWVVVPYFKHTRKILNQEIVKLDDYLNAGLRLLKAGAEYVIIPYHCDRLLFSKDQVYQLSPLGFCLRNWLGAGDAYNSFFLDYVIRKGFDFIEANRYGAAAALYIAENKPIFIENRQQVEDNLARIDIKKLGA